MDALGALSAVPHTGIKMVKPVLPPTAEREAIDGHVETLRNALIKAGVSTGIERDAFFEGFRSELRAQAINRVGLQLRGRREALTRCRPSRRPRKRGLLRTGPRRSRPLDTRATTLRQDEVSKAQRRSSRVRFLLALLRKRIRTQLEMHG